MEHFVESNNEIPVFCINHQSLNIRNTLAITNHTIIVSLPHILAYRLTPQDPKPTSKRHTSCCIRCHHPDPIGCNLPSPSPLTCTLACLPSATCSLLLSVVGSASCGSILLVASSGSSRRLRLLSSIGCCSGSAILLGRCGA